MFSAETLITMANGTIKNINSIKPNEFILNKLRKPVQVKRINKTENTQVVEVQLNNGTGTFFCAPNTIFYCHHTTPQGAHTTQYCTISDAHSEEAKLKNSINLFSPDTDVSITSYDDSNHDLKKDTYTLYAIDESKSFFANGVITTYVN